MLIDYEKMRELFLACDINLTESQYASFNAYAKLLVEWNEKINLTTITDSEGIAEKHFLDSILPFFLSERLKEMVIERKCSLIDVGAGAGFPSCPLKIMNDEISLTMLDSLNKRINFLKEVSSEIGFEADCVHSRAEDGAKVGSPLREHFDIAAARAVASLPVLCEYCMPFARVGGYFVSLKGGSCENEIQMSKKAISTLGGKIVESIGYSLPSGDKRTAIIIKKIAKSPDKFPRSKAQMNKYPL